jgi:hypothetical protein
MTKPIPVPINTITGPTTVTTTIPSYLYQQYSDDQDLQAFVSSYNTMTQQYVSWFNSTLLPVYTDASITGGLLDWVALGLYGFTRPILPSGLPTTRGAYDTWAYNTVAYNQFSVLPASSYYVTNDDIFKRVLTWHLYKGDGKQFSIKWLKRRIIRFLTGTNGAGGVNDNTYQVSVSFSGSQVNITIRNSIHVITGGAIYGVFAYGSVGYNVVRAKTVNAAPLTNSAVLQAAINSGVLELPFQYTYTVSILN